MKNGGDDENEKKKKRKDLDDSDYDTTLEEFLVETGLKQKDEALERPDQNQEEISHEEYTPTETYMDKPFEEEQLKKKSQEEESIFDKELVDTGDEYDINREISEIDAEIQETAEEEVKQKKALEDTNRKAFNVWREPRNVQEDLQKKARENVTPKARTNLQRQVKPKKKLPKRRQKTDNEIENEVFENARMVGEEYDRSRQALKDTNPGAEYEVWRSTKELHKRRGHHTPRKKLPKRKARKKSPKEMPITIKAYNPLGMRLKKLGNNFVKLFTRIGNKKRREKAWGKIKRDVDYLFSSKEKREKIDDKYFKDKLKKGHAIAYPAKLVKQNKKRKKKKTR